MSIAGHRTWPLIIVLLLLGHAGTMAFFVLLATTNPSTAVEKDYYRKALRWDQVQAQRQRDRELGWQIEVIVEPASEPEGEASLVMLLEDAAGLPLTGAAVRLEAFHNARAAHALTAALAEGVAGAYHAMLPIHRSGLWELRFEVVHPRGRLTRKVRKHLVLTPPATGAPG